MPYSLTWEPSGQPGNPGWIWDFEHHKNRPFLLVITSTDNEISVEAMRRQSMPCQSATVAFPSRFLKIGEAKNLNSWQENWGSPFFLAFPALKAHSCCSGSPQVPPGSAAAHVWKRNQTIQGLNLTLAPSPRKPCHSGSCVLELAK